MHAHTSGFRAFSLSDILESADDIDQVFNRVARYGGRVSKPPTNAGWGYSAYVTDPSGYLWKIASSKRPLLDRNASATNNGHAISPQEVSITIGVAHMKRAKDFYTLRMRICSMHKQAHRENRTPSRCRST